MSKVNKNSTVYSNKNRIEIIYQNVTILFSLFRIERKKKNIY